MGCDSLVFSNFSNPLGSGVFLVGTAFHADVAWHSRRCGSSLHEQYDRQVFESYTPSDFVMSNVYCNL